MKKILFTLLLIAGGFVAQAQNTVSVGTWITSGQAYGLIFSEDIQACFNDAQMTSVEEITYSWDSSTRTLSFGENSVLFPGAQGDTYDTTFAASNYLLIPLLADRSAIDGSIPIPTQPIAN